MQSRFGQRLRLTLVAAVAALGLFAVGATGAQAKWVKLTGETQVTPSDQVKQFLASKNVSVAPVDPATAAGGVFTFPLRVGFGNTKNYNGILVHNGGLKFSRGAKSAVVRGFVAVRHNKTAFLLAKVPALRGGCGHIRKAVRRFLVNHPVFRRKAGKRVRRFVRKHPKAARHVVQAVRNYCNDGRVIVLARLTDVGKSVSGNTATLTADLRLSRQATNLLNRRFGTRPQRRRPARLREVDGDARRLERTRRKPDAADGRPDGPPVSRSWAGRESISRVDTLTPWRISVWSWRGGCSTPSQRAEWRRCFRTSTSGSRW